MAGIRMIMGMLHMIMDIAMPMGTNTTITRMTMTTNMITAATMIMMTMITTMVTGITATSTIETR